MNSYSNIVSCFVVNNSDINNKYFNNINKNLDNLEDTNSEK